MNEYVFARDVLSSVRLDAQHLMWKMQTGYLMHPAIPVRDGMKIAEIVTGTGIWLLDLASHLPPSAQLHGFDISDGQYPPSNTRPANVHLDVLDALGDVPDHLAEQYDVVHIRLLCCIVREGNVAPLIQHALKLLKPGGFIQWEDSDAGNLVTSGPASEAFQPVMQQTANLIGLSFKWLSELPEILQKMGVSVLDVGQPIIKPQAIPGCTSTFIMAHLEFSPKLDDLKHIEGILPKEEYQKLALAAFESTRKGERFHWTPVAILGQKK